MQNQKYQAKKYSSLGSSEVNDDLVLEEALKISINDDIFSITMRTPGSDKELVVGLLYSEDIYTKQIKNLIYKSHKEDSITLFNIELDYKHLRKGYLNSRSLLSVASCGICGKTELDKVRGIVSDSQTVSLRELNEMFLNMSKKQNLFIQSGGSHAAAIFDDSQKILSLQEDIGRHNAVDKTIGELLLSNNLDQANCLLVSGRISYEIIIKTFRAKIGILAAVSAPSSLAVDFAKELGITLLGFCRDGKATCYANDYRIKKA